MTGITRVLMVASLVFSLGCEIAEQERNFSSHGPAKDAGASISAPSASSVPKGQPVSASPAKTNLEQPPIQPLTSIPSQALPSTETPSANARIAYLSVVPSLAGGSSIHIGAVNGTSDDNTVFECSNCFITSPMSITVDGTHIAFSSNHEGDPDKLYTVDVSTKVVKRLTTSSAGGEMWPSYSHNGKFIAFASGRLPRMQLKVISIDTLQEGDIPSPHPVEHGIVWSPDDERIAIVRNVSRGGIAAGDIKIYIVQLKTGVEKVLTDQIGDYNPVWSNDGKLLFFVRDHRNICVVPSEGGEVKTVATRQDVIRNLSFSEGRGRLLWDECIGGSLLRGGLLRNIFCMEKDGGAPTNLTPSSKSSYEHPVWSSDGGRIAFTSNMDRKSDFGDEIYIINADGSGLTRSTNTGTSKSDITWITVRQP